MSVLKEFTEFVRGPYLQYNLYAASSGYTWEELDTVNRLGSFFKRGLRGDKRNKEGKSVLEIYTETILEGSRYAVDDLEGGKEVKEVIEMMIEKGGENVIEEVEEYLFEPLREFEDDLGTYLEEIFIKEGHHVRGWLFRLFKTDMRKYVSNWEELEGIEIEEGRATQYDCLSGIKRIIEKGLY
jgi:hypothetical protein